MNEKRLVNKPLNKKLIIISAILLVIIALQSNALTRKEVRQKFRCALRRIRNGQSPLTSTAAAGGGGGGGGASGAAATSNTAAATSTTAGATTTTAAITTTTAPATTTGPFPPNGWRVSQTCNVGSLPSNSVTEAASYIQSNNYQNIYT